MTARSNIEELLERLRQALPDPFGLGSRMDLFLNQPAAQELIAGGQRSIEAILDFLTSGPDPALARPAILLLSCFAPGTFYPKLLVLLQEADEPLVQAFEPGLWLIQVPEEQIANALVRVVASSQNPHPLLLLQRPVAKTVRLDLAAFVRKRRLPVSLYALYCFRYAIEPEDVPLMTAVSLWVEIPEMSALAGLYLLKFGSKEGLLGIRAGLLAPNEHVRTAIYYELAEYLSKTVIKSAKYDPVQQGETQQAAVDVLMGFLGGA